MTEKTSKEAASAAARVLRDPNASEDAKTAAGSALTQREPERVADSEHAAFEGWLYLSQTKYDPSTMSEQEIELAEWAYQAGRAALQSQHREDAELVEILREAAEIIAAVPTDYAPENLRGPIVDELEGFALMLDHARRIEGEGNG